MLSLTGTPERWNDATVDAWLRRVPGRVSRRLLEVIASISWTADLDRYSVHAMARMVRQQGGLRTILSTRGGAQDSLLVEGVGTLTDRLAAELGARVRTGHRVTRLVRDEHGVTVHTDSGTFRAARTIVTVPPPVAARIEHHPPLPADRAALERNTYMGSVYKAIAVFERPLWRDRGRAEFLVLDSPGRAVFDTGSPGGPGHLCTLVAGPEARALDGLDAEERRQVLLAPLVPHLGPGVLKPAGWHEKAWHLDEHAGGGYVVLPEPGTTEGISPLPHTPLGPVHWAGTETADEHAGYLEGAIASGVRAAREVVDALAAGAPR
ncbi:NAD(P)/FAD-dependent oxidoreductase [Streptomyces cavourensis]